MPTSYRYKYRPKGAGYDVWVTKQKHGNRRHKSNKSEGCYIATAVYGSYDAKEVIILRRFRDEKLKRTFLGRLFIKTYYFLSPPIANRLKNARHINRFVKNVLDRWVKRLDSEEKKLREFR